MRHCGKSSRNYRNPHRLILIRYRHPLRLASVSSRLCTFWCAQSLLVWLCKARSWCVLLGSLVRRMTKKQSSWIYHRSRISETSRLRRYSFVFRSAGRVERGGGLGGDVHGWAVEGFEHDLRRLSRLAFGLSGTSVRKTGWTQENFWGDSELVVEGVVSDPVHVALISDNAVLDWVRGESRCHAGTGLLKCTKSCVNNIWRHVSIQMGKRKEKKEIHRSEEAVWGGEDVKTARGASPPAKSALHKCCLPHDSI